MSPTRASTLLVPALTAIAGGAVGALVALAFMRPSRAQQDASPRAEPAQASPSPANEKLDGRVAALERSVQRLALQSSVANAAARSKPAPGDGTGEADGSPRVADVAPIVDSPVFDAAVRDVLQRAEEERALEREAQRSEWRQRAADDWANQVAEKLRLSEAQKAKVTAVASSFWERVRDLRSADAGAAGSRKDWRERVQALRKSAEGELAQVLDSAQMSAYRELDEGAQLDARPRGGGQRGGDRSRD